MKGSTKLILACFICLAWQSLLQAQTITTGVITGSPFCPNANITVPFIPNGSFSPANVFTAQLSDASGSFASPVNIGTLSTPGITINAVIPASATGGTGYRIRVVSSNPLVTGTDNGTDLIIASALSEVTGAGVIINDGDVTPSTIDNTDFGTAAVSASATKIFVINNAGSSNLIINNITIGGGDASQFSISSLSPASPIPAGSSASFTVTFSPASAGLKTATININNTSCNTGVYDFTIQGNATAPIENILAFQGFENGQCDTWSFAGGNTNTELSYTGSRSARIGRSGESNTLTFNSLNTTGFAGLKLSMYHAVRPGMGPGMDTREGAVILISLNGGAFTPISRVGGFGDANWGFNSTMGGSGSSSSGCTIYQSPNPVVYNIPAGTTSVQVRVVSVGRSSATCATFNTAMNSGTAANFDRTDEGFFIDDIKITTTNPLPIVLTSATGTDAQTVCINNAIAPIKYSVAGNGGATVTGLPAGITGSYSGGIFTISGTPTTATGSPFNYIVNATCTGASITGVLTVRPATTLTLTSATATTTQGLCVNTAINNITYAIDGSGTGATVSGLPAGVTGVYNSGVFTISGTPTTIGVFNYIVTTTGPCTPQVTATGTITINPDATTTLTSAAGTANQALCVNTAIANITYNVTGGGTEATVSGLPTGVTGIYISGVFTISGIPTATGTFNYTVTTTGSCAQVTATGSITVNPNATITLTSAAGTDNQTLCINTALTNITYAIAGGGTGATANGLPAGVIGIYNAGVFTISGTPTAAGTFNYTVTTTGECPQVTATGTININPDATITLISTAGTDNQTLCINTVITNISYNISGSATGATVSGLPAGVTGAYNAGVFNISGIPTTAGVFNYTVSTTGPCAPKNNAGTITVTPSIVPSINITANPGGAVCTGTFVTFTATIVNGGTAPIYQWKKNGNNVGNNAATYTDNTLMNADVITCELISNASCLSPATAISNSLQATLNAPTVPTFASIAPVCQNATAPILSTTSTNGITGTWSPAVSTATTGITTYTFTPDANQCATTTTLQITIDAPVIPTFNLIPPVCQNAAAPILPATSTNGIQGTWSPAVTTALAGNRTYTFTPANGQCAATTTLQITVNPLPTLMVNPLTSTVCLGSSTPLQATSNGIVQWQGFGLGTNNINVSPTANGSYVATATSANGCTTTATALVNVQTSFNLNISATPNPVVTGSALNLNTSSSVAYQITAWQPSALFPNQTSITQSIIANATAEYYAVAKSLAGCTDTARIIVKTITDNDDLFIPNFFTPNNDGLNDVLKVYGTSIESLEMKIFNQWGEMIFETRDISKGWDGTQSGRKQPVGVYIYVVKVLLQNGKTVTKKGSINLLR